MIKIDAELTDTEFFDLAELFSEKQLRLSTAAVDPGLTRDEKRQLTSKHSALNTLLGKLIGA